MRVQLPQPILCYAPDGLLTKDAVHDHAERHHLILRALLPKHDDRYLGVYCEGGQAVALDMKGVAAQSKPVEAPAAPAPAASVVPATPATAAPKAAKAPKAAPAPRALSANQQAIAAAQQQAKALGLKANGSLVELQARILAAAK